MWDSITATCAKTMAIYAPMIQHNTRHVLEGKAIESRPFTVLGLDLLIDEQMKAWILEVNDHPSLNIYFDNSKEFFQQREMTDDDVCPLDLYVKSRLVGDMISLANTKDLTSVTKFGSLTNIFPNKENTMTRTVTDLQKLFSSTSRIREFGKVSSQAFEKLAEKPLLKQLGLQKIDLGLTMQAVT